MFAKRLNPAAKPLYRAANPLNGTANALAVGTRLPEHPASQLNAAAKPPGSYTRDVDTTTKPPNLATRAPDRATEGLEQITERQNTGPKDPEHFKTKQSEARYCNISNTQTLIASSYLPAMLVKLMKH